MLKVHVQKVGDVAVFCLRGCIGVGETSVLRKAVLSHLDVGSIVLDFGKVNRIDAAGLGLLLELREQTQAKRIPLKFMNVTKLIKHVMEITCLIPVFQFTSEGEILSTPAGTRTDKPFRLVACTQ
ncbi:MAG TPA: STAS domain-containing protein [Pyrinomonadaceae bacterium]|jgi:anti-anti-sigma factor|nr:STAS domain-containing protein [Pyrinomonadaceae bacterium]